jgi:ATPase subunit of ABC transporter with duplicated ATPase domains
LLRILAGLVQPDQGGVGLSPPAATVGYLSQEPERRPGESIDGFIARRTGVARAQQDLAGATALLAGEKPGAGILRFECVQTLGVSGAAAARTRPSQSVRAWRAAWEIAA